MTLVFKNIRKLPLQRRRTTPRPRWGGASVTEKSEGNDQVGVGGRERGCGLAGTTDHGPQKSELKEEMV